MNGEDFAYFRWHCFRFPGGGDCTGHWAHNMCHHYWRNR